MFSGTSKKRRPSRDNRALTPISLDFRLWLDLMLTSSAPDDDLHMGRRRAAERRGWAAVGFHQRSLRCPDRAESQGRPRCLRAAEAPWEEFELDDVAPVIELTKELIGAHLG